ncbi:phosphatidate cytidylyltransferase [Demequina lutea]|uniref:Phosphatidate cytidylyltransferase n=1 Tax=Demequina lutea TaxID=431489 RepID=A0A7Y9ZAJ2_9MICO|nr:phosphatidate cytidylyltransferase [Demequina lutea]NYI41842.1 CDP-diglyceride synthetase [Demequina lutea]
MAADDSERSRSAPDEQPREQTPPRGKRQRAADLFSPHRYRALQLKAFERRAGRATEPDADVPDDDDVIDPPLYSDMPAAEAARANFEGIERHEPFDLLSPIDAPQVFDFPFDPNAGVDDGELGDDDEVEHPEWEEPASGEFQTGELPDGEDESGALEPAEHESGEVEGAQVETVQLQTYRQAEFGGPGDSLEPDGTESWEERPDVPSGKGGRLAGRNMPVATAVGLALLAVTVAASYYHELAFAAVLYTFAVGAVIEWKRALERHGRRIPVVPLVAATLGLGVATYYGKAEGLVVALLVGCAGVVAWRIGDERIENTLADSLAGILTLLWIPFLASFLFLLELADNGWERVVIVVLAVVGNDTGALIAGSLLGRHKLLERVSPAKTWEGAIGGLLLGTAAASVAAYFFFDGKWYIGAAVGFASAVAAVIGDLAESALKRDIQVKDMSSALPGHGGILDRIDSLLFAAPVGYVVFAIFLGTLGGGGL